MHFTSPSHIRHTATLSSILPSFFLFFSAKCSHTVDFALEFLTSVNSTGAAILNHVITQHDKSKIYCIFLNKVSVFIKSIYFPVLCRKKPSTGITSKKNRYFRRIPRFAPRRFRTEVTGTPVKPRSTTKQFLKHHFLIILATLYVV